jgi:hypothetical protein
LAGKGPTYENIEQRKYGESADFRGRTGKPKDKEKVKDREAKAEETAKKELKEWKELQDYLPHIFLGDPNRYGGARGP